MKEAAAIVILMIAFAVRNRTAFPISEHIGMNPRAVDYMLGGAFEAILAAIIAVLVWNWRETFWRALALLTAGFVVFEGLQRPVCRLLITDLRQVGANQNLCEYLTGLPISPWTGWTYFIALCVVFVVTYKKRT